MIRLYYDSQTGIIQKSVTAKFAPSISELPYIDVESAVNSQKYKVDIVNKILIPNPDYQPPAPFTR
jgi:hypothetical protein